VLSFNISEIALAISSSSNQNKDPMLTKITQKNDQQTRREPQYHAIMNFYLLLVHLIKQTHNFKLMEKYKKNGKSLPLHSVMWKFI
jgi:hypothetical protein